MHSFLAMPIVNLRWGRNSNFKWSNNFTLFVTRVTSEVYHYAKAFIEIPDLRWNILWGCTIGGSISKLLSALNLLIQFSQFCEKLCCYHFLPLRGLSSTSRGGLQLSEKRWIIFKETSEKHMAAFGRCTHSIILIMPKLYRQHQTI